MTCLTRTTPLLVSILGLVPAVVMGEPSKGSTVVPCPYDNDPAYCRAIAAFPDDDGQLRAGDGFQVSGELSTVFAARHGASVSNVTLASVHVDLSTGFPHLRYFGALDLAAGLAVGDADVGLAYDVQLLPIGVGLQIRRPENTAFLGIATGIGASGAQSALPSAAMIPIQLTGVFRLTERVNLQSRIRASWLLNKTSRSNGGSSVPGVDELDAILALQHSNYENYIEGYFYGVAYRELEGGRFVGLVLGWAGGEELGLGYTNGERLRRRGALSSKRLVQRARVIER